MELNRREFLGGAAAFAAVGGGFPAFASEPRFAFDPAVCTIDPTRMDNPLYAGGVSCGVNLGFLAKRGYYARPDVIGMADRMRATGVNTCIVNCSFCQEAYFSTKLFFDSVYSSGEDELAGIIRALKRNGIRVILKPNITVLDSSWMGRVSFPATNDRQIQGVDKCATYRRDWFNSFRDAHACYADLAARNGVDAILIGAELSGVQWEVDEWHRTIEMIRKRYSGLLTYEFIYNMEPAGDDSKVPAYCEKVPFYDPLDFVSLSWYPRARPHVAPEKFAEQPVTSLDEMVAYLEPCRKKFDWKCDQYGGKPVLFTEIGTRSSHGCVSNPLDAFAKGAYDAQEQADYLEAVFRTFADKSHWMGLCWWKWDETQVREHYDPDPKKDRGFWIDGKPAADVFRRWSEHAVAS